MHGAFDGAFYAAKVVMSERAENVGVRRVRFGGVVTDRGLTSLGDGVEAIVGALGVTP